MAMMGSSWDEYGVFDNEGSIKFFAYQIQGKNKLIAQGIALAVSRSYLEEFFKNAIRRSGTAGVIIDNDITVVITELPTLKDDNIDNKVILLCDETIHALKNLIKS